MIGVTAILHTHNDELRIARAVESLRCCEEVLVIDHASADGTREAARRFGARVVATEQESFLTRDIIREARHDWVFCVQATEAVSETLEAALLEWKMAPEGSQTALSVSILEETAQGWISFPPETRLVRHAGIEWNGWKPLASAEYGVLDGNLLRMRVP